VIFYLIRVTTASNVAATMNGPREIIRREIEVGGAISFARFMELSLYCPETGYYERLGNNPGARGDFYTNVSVGSLFGELLAFQFESWIEGGRSEKIQLLEAGAHDGRLALDILNWLASCRPGLFKEMEYWIWEPSLLRQQSQLENLGRFGEKIRWFRSWECLPASGVRGIMFSNELLDAMPVHRVGWNAREKSWFEWCVGWEGDRFVWRRSPAESAMRGPGVEASFHRLRRNLSPPLLAVLPDGFTTEICPAAAQWWRQAAAILKHGRLLTFDYGLCDEEFFSPHRANGTLRAYHRHKLGGDVLGNTGEQDLTAHVNFSSLIEAGESAGLQTEGLYSQAEFLARVAEPAWRDKSVFGEWTPARARQFQTLTHPEHLGRSFKVLVQRR
jgi:SAM-dependent MidA family methyltransferase